MTKVTRRTGLGLLAAAMVAPSFVYAEGIPKPKAGKGLIIFYRASAGPGNSIRFDITDGDGNVVAQMKRGAIVPVDIAPGAHFFRVPDANKVEGTIDVAAGQTIYVRSYINTATNIDGRPQFMVVSEAEGRQDLIDLGWQ